MSRKLSSICMFMSYIVIATYFLQQHTHLNQNKWRSKFGQNLDLSPHQLINFTKPQYLKDYANPCFRLGRTEDGYKVLATEGENEKNVITGKSNKLEWTIFNRSR